MEISDFNWTNHHNVITFQVPLFFIFKPKPPPTLQHNQTQNLVTFKKAELGCFKQKLTQI